MHIVGEIHTHVKLEVRTSNFLEIHEILAPQVHQLIKLDQIHTTTCKVNSGVHKLVLRKQIGTKAIRK
jgi:hypothetical protein